MKISAYTCTVWTDPKTLIIYGSKGSILNRFLWWAWTAFRV